MLAPKLLRLAAPHRVVHRLPARLVFGVALEHEARRALERLAGRVTEDLLEATVAAHGPAIARELDADDDVVEERLLLRQHALQFLLSFALLRDVLDDPHRAPVRLARLDRAAVGPVPEGAA